ncbi:MAG: phosphocholine cytidylyltransferase family protein [Rhodobacteraceae bacterium]|nr:phosphocholine cytidylyltransferase family protein [Paracoccaceae bacterium]
MGEITAVILAAGMGVRMGSRGKLMPKGLLEVGGERLIGQAIAALRGHGVAKIIIVTGHLGEQYEAVFAATDVELIHNPYYATTGSLRTLATVLDRVESACLIVESDLIFAPQALAPLDGSCSRFLVSGPTGAGDEQYVWVEPDSAGRQMMRMISKDPHAWDGDPLGEMIGLSILSRDDTFRMRRVAGDVLARTPDEHYEPGLVALSREVPIECPLLPNTPWAEIDDEDMLTRAQGVIYPRVAAARAAFGPS